MPHRALRFDQGPEEEFRRRAEREREKRYVAAEQLERAELYVVAAAQLELADRDLRRALESLRADVQAVRDLLLRPRRVD